MKHIKNLIFLLFIYLFAKELLLINDSLIIIIVFAYIFYGMVSMLGLITSNQISKYRDIIFQGYSVILKNNTMKLMSLVLQQKQKLIYISAIPLYFIIQSETHFSVIT